MSNRLNQTGLGVRNAFDFWLSQHPISFGELLESTIKAAILEWLEEHSAEVIEAIRRGSRQDWRGKDDETGEGDG